MSFASSDPQVFLPLLEGELNQLPDLAFRKDDSTFAVEVDTLATLINNRLEADTSENDAESEDEKAAMIVRKVMKAYMDLKKDPTYNVNFATLSKYSSMLTGNITQTFSILRNKVKPRVDKLKSTIQDNMKQVALSHQVVLDGEAPKIDFKTIRWDSFYNVLNGFENITAEVAKLVKFQPSPTFSDLQTIMESDVTEIEQVELDPEVEEDFIENATKNSTPEQKEAVEEALNVVTDNYHFRKMLAGTARAAIRETDLMPILENCRHVINNVYPAILRLKSTPMNVVKPLEEKLHANINKALSAVMVIGFTVGCIDNHLKDSYVISHDTLNGDNASPNQEDEQENQDAAMKHVITYYLQHNIPVPSRGISLETIKAEKERSQEAYDRLLATQESDNKSNRVLIMQEAAYPVLNQYLMEAADGNDETDADGDAGMESFAEMHYTDLRKAINSLDNISLESVLFQFVIDTTFPLPAVQKAHDLSGKEVIKLMEANPDLDQASLNLIDATVGANLAAEFLIKSLTV